MNTSLYTDHLYLDQTVNRNFFEPNAVAPGDVVLAHLNTFSPMKADLLRSRRLVNTWKTGFAIKASQCSSHLH